MGIFEWMFSQRRKEFVVWNTKEETGGDGGASGGSTGGGESDKNVVEFFIGWASSDINEEFFAGVFIGVVGWEWEVEEGECAVKRGVDGDEEFVW